MLVAELARSILKFQRAHGRRALFLDEDSVSVTPTLAGAGETVQPRQTGEERWACHAAQAVCSLLRGNVDMLAVACALQKMEYVCAKHIPTTNYSSFLTSSFPVAHTYLALSSMVPRFQKYLHEAVGHRLDLTCDWQKDSDLSDMARFLFALTVALALLLEETGSTNRKNVPALGFLPRDKVMPLRIVYVVSGEYGVFMDPIRNTIHASSLDIAFLQEQFANSCRSLSKYNEICGVCTTLQSVEENAKRLLKLRAIQRSAKLDECQHAHCLFKLSLYWQELNGSLGDCIIEPSTEFKLVPGTDGVCVLRLLWCASWQGRSADTTQRRVLMRTMQRWRAAADAVLSEEEENSDNSTAVGMSDDEDSDDGGEAFVEHMPPMALAE